MTILQVNSHSIDQKSGEIWTVQADLQPITFKSDRLLTSLPPVKPRCVFGQAQPVTGDIAFVQIPQVVQGQWAEIVPDERDVGAQSLIRAI